MVEVLIFALLYFFFFFNDTAATAIYTLSLHDALPISLFIILLLIVSKKEFSRKRFLFTDIEYFLFFFYCKNYLRDHDL